ADDRRPRHHARAVAVRRRASAERRRARRPRTAGGMKEPMAKERWTEQFREALAEVEEQRDDTVIYLSAIKLVLEVLARGRDPRQSGQEIAEALLGELAVET